jgi:hypothetical protein
MKILNKTKDYLAILISLFALLVAIISVIISYQNYKKDFPEINIEQLIPSGSKYLSKKDNIWLFYYHHDILITNNGGRPVSLITITKGNSPDFLLPMVDNKINKALVINYSFNLVDKTFNEIMGDPAIIDNMTSINLNNPKYINLLIKPGETHILRYGFKFYPYERNKKTIDMIILSLKLNFNNGFKKTINHSIKITDINTGNMFLMF